MKRDVFTFIKFFAMLSIFFFHTTADFLSTDDKNVEIFFNSLNNSSFTEYMQIFYSMIYFLALFIPITLGFALEKHFTYIDNANWDEFKEKFYRLSKLALFFLATGSIINISSWGIEEILVWDIFHLYSFAIIFSSIFIYIFNKKLYYLLFFVFFFGMSFIPETIYEESNFFIQALFGDPLGDSFWSIFPWFSLIIYGVFLKSIINNKNLNLFLNILLYSSLAGIYISFNNGDLFSIVDFKNIWGKEIFLPSLSQLISHLCKFNLVLYFIIKYCKSNKIKKKSFVDIIGNYSLFLFIIHMLVGKYFNSLIKFLLLDIFNLNGYIYYFIMSMLILLHIYLLYLIGLFIDRNLTRALFFFVERKRNKKN